MDAALIRAFLISRTSIGRVTVAVLAISDELRAELQRSLIAELLFCERSQGNNFFAKKLY
jgi:hypothetical protein